MTRNHWIATLLLASWTLNVTLIVTLYLKSTPPPGGYRQMAPRYTPPMPMSKVEFGDRMPPPGPMRHEVQRFQGDMKPLMEKQQYYLARLQEVFINNELDTLLISQLGDSLAIARRSQHDRMIRHLSDMHPHLSPEQRSRLASRMIRNLRDKGRWKGGRGHLRKRMFRDSIRSVETH